MKKIALLGGLLLVPLSAGTAAPGATDWPSWRGADGSGIGAGTPPLEWSEERNVRWKTPLPGLGSATPIVWQDRAYVLSAIGGEPDPDARPSWRGSAPPSDSVDWVVLAYDTETGAEVWRRTARSQPPYAGKHATNSYASASALTDGEHLWAFFGSYGLYALDLDGNVLWEKDFGAMETRLNFGEGASPALHGDSIVVVWDHEGESWIAAFDKLSGQEQWRVDRDEPTTWATPLVVEHDGTTQVITAGTNRVRSYDLADGSLLWEGPGLTLNAIPSPLYADGVVYFAAGFRGSALMAVDLGAANGRIDDTPAVLWRVERDTPYVPSPLLLGDLIYYVKSNDAIISAARASTGERVFGPQRVEGVREIYASPAAANGYVYIVGRDGGATILRQGDEYDVVATNSLDDGFDASPAFVGDSIYLRGRSHLYRIAADTDG